MGLMVIFAIAGCYLLFVAYFSGVGPPSRILYLVFKGSFARIVFIIRSYVIFIHAIGPLYGTIEPLYVIGLSISAIYIRIFHCML